MTADNPYANPLLALVDHKEKGRSRRKRAEQREPILIRLAREKSERLIRVEQREYPFS